MMKLRNDTKSPYKTYKNHVCQAVGKFRKIDRDVVLGEIQVGEVVGAELQAVARLFRRCCSLGNAAADSSHRIAFYLRRR